MEIQWSLVIFTTLAGCGAWLAAILGLNELRGDVKDASTKSIAAIAALALVIVGGIASVTHLSHPDRIMAALGHPTSGIFMEALFVGLIAIALIVYLAAVKRNASAGALKGIGVVVGVIGLVMTFVLGYSYMMEGRPAWNTPLLPLGYMFTALPAGAGAWMAICGMKKEDTSFAGLLLCVGGILGAVFAVLYGFVSGVAMGAQAALFWLLPVVIGGVAPAVCGYFGRAKASQAVTMGWVGFACALVGCAGFRCLMWLTGMPVDNFFGLI